MDGPFIVYNTCEPEANVEYQILNTVPICDNGNMKPSSTVNSNSINKYSAENANLFAKSWMTPEAIYMLKELLTEWNFECLFPVFCDECIDVDALKIMTPQHLKQLGKKWNLKLGIQIKLENSVTLWKNRESSPSSSTNTNLTLDKNANEIYDTEDNILPSDNISTSIDIEQIMKSSSQGRAVLKLFKNNLKLNEGSRAVIVDLTTNYLIYNDIPMTVKLAKQIAELIVQVFQTESVEYYYLKQPGKKPQGKLYDKYFNVMRKLKQGGIVQKRPYVHKSSHDINKRVLNIDVPEENIDESIEALVVDNCSWAEVESHWAATKNYRLHEISHAKTTSEILNKWAQYKKPFGFKLVNIDFKQIYPKPACFHVNFETFASKIESVFEDRIKDQSNKLLFETMKQTSDISENGRCFGIFYLLHSILVPSVKVFNVLNGKKICTRFSIRDSQRSFLIEENTVAACEEELLKKYETKVQIQPLLLISGSILEPKDIIVYFEGIKYRMHSALDAIDICFKIFFVFNLEYPKESVLVWTFIQKYLYNITTNIDYSSPQINALISNLK